MAAKPNVGWATTLTHGAGGDRAGGGMDLDGVFLAAADESAEAVERRERPGVRGGGAIVAARFAAGREPRRQRRDRRERTNELLIEPALRRVHDGSRRGLEQRLILGRHEIGPAQEHTARLVGPSMFGAALQHLHERLLEVLTVAGAVLVEHDEIERQSLGAQVLVRLEQIAEERELGSVGETRDQHGSVARDAVLPQFGLAAAVRLHGVARAQAGIGVEQPASQALEQDRVVDRESEVPQLDLAVRAGERQRPGDRAPVVVLLHQAVGVFFGLRKAGDESDAGRAAGRQPHELTQRDDRIEHRTGRVRERVRGGQRDRILERAAAPDEARAIRLELRRRADAPAAAEQVEEVGPGAARRAAGARRSAHRARGAPRSR